MAEEKEVMISSSLNEEQTPSRSELLSMIKKHSSFLGESTVDEQEASDINMDPKFWHKMMDLYFIHGRVLKGSQEDDDLVFFVRNRSHEYSSDDDVDNADPFFVRRWGPEVLGEVSPDADWPRSFFLNLIAHTSFTVTVAICSHQSLQRHSKEKDDPISPIYKVVKTVYASPSRVDFQLDHKKAVETSPAYPNICFSVDDFDDTFDAVVLSERDHCYCVLLNANGGAAFATEDTFDGNSLLVNNDSLERSNSPKITLFSGYVSYQMVREAYSVGKSRFGSLLSMNHQNKMDKLYMKGPGGQGEVEVAVSGVADQSYQEVDPPSPPSPLSLSTKGLAIGLGSVVHKAASAASVLAKQAFAATSTNRQLDLDLIPLKCCLMSISLPWECIANDLLFKVEPPVNM